MAGGKGFVKSSRRSFKVREFLVNFWIAEADPDFLVFVHTEFKASHHHLMANVFGILTAIVLAIAAFVAYQNKAAYATEITNFLVEKGKLEESQKRLKIAQDHYADTLAKRTGVDEEVVKLWGVESAQKKTNAELTQQIADKTAKSDSNKGKLDEIREKTAKIGDIQELASKMRSINTELEELAQSITGTEAKLANLTAQNNQSEKQADAMKKKFEIISSGQSLPTLKTQIRSIYPTWGFVTLACGNRGGVVTHSTLDVVRDGSTIAKLLVTAVETNSASASIIPDSVAQDVTLMVGDRVIPSVKAAPPVVLPKPVPVVIKLAPAPKPVDPAVPAIEPAADPAATPAADPAVTPPAADPAVTPAP